LGGVYMIEKILTMYKSYFENGRRDNIIVNELIVQFLKKEFNLKTETRDEQAKEILEKTLWKAGYIAYILTNEDEYCDTLEDLYTIIHWCYVDIKKENVPKEIEEIDNKYEKENRKKLNMTTFTCDKLIEKGWTIEEIVTESVSICLNEIEDLGEGLTGDMDKWVEIHKVDYDLIGGVFYRGRIIGEWAFSLLNNKDYKKMAKGKLKEEDIIVIKKRDKNHLYKAYIEAIVIEKKYRNAKALSLMMDTFFNQMEVLAKKGMYIGDFVTNAFTKEGNILCKFIEMKYVCEHIDGGSMYVKKFYPIDSDNSYMKKYPNLLKEYNRYKLEVDNMNEFEKLKLRFN